MHAYSTTVHELLNQRKHIILVFSMIQGAIFVATLRRYYFRDKRVNWLLHRDTVL